MFQRLHHFSVELRPRFSFSENITLFAVRGKHSSDIGEEDQIMWSKLSAFNILYRDGGTCRVTDYATHSFTFLYCRLHRRYYNLPLQAVFTLTVLTIRSFCRLSWLSTISVGARLFTVDSRLSLSLLSPTTDFLFCHSFQLPSHCLKKGLAGPKGEHLPLLFIYAVCHSVTYETSVLLVRCVAAASF
jgi:hypothetical protein